MLGGGGGREKSIRPAKAVYEDQPNHRPSLDEGAVLIRLFPHPRLNIPPLRLVAVPKPRS